MAVSSQCLSSALSSARRTVWFCYLSSLQNRPKVWLFCWSRSMLSLRQVWCGRSNALNLCKLGSLTLPKLTQLGFASNSSRKILRKPIPFHQANQTSTNPTGSRSHKWNLLDHLHQTGLVFLTLPKRGSPKMLFWKPIQIASSNHPKGNKNKPPPLPPFIGAKTPLSFPKWIERNRLKIIGTITSTRGSQALLGESRWSGWRSGEVEEAGERMIFLFFGGMSGGKWGENDGFLWGRGCVECFWCFRGFAGVFKCFGVGGV